MTIKTPIQYILENKVPCGTNHLKSRLINEGLIKNQCSNTDCKISEWHGKPIVLHLDHINGVKLDNSLSNLRLLCPNCHSQTTTYSGKNMGNKKHTMYTDEVIKEACKDALSVKHAMEIVGYITPSSVFRKRVSVFYYQIHETSIARNFFNQKFETREEREKQRQLQLNKPSVYKSGVREKHKDYFINKQLTEKVINSDINFKKRGWVGSVGKIIDRKPQCVKAWMKKYMPEFYKNCLIRKTPKRNKTKI